VSTLLTIIPANDDTVAEFFFKYLKHEELNRKSFSSIKDLGLSLFENEP